MKDLKSIFVACAVSLCTFALTNPAAAQPPDRKPEETTGPPAASMPEDGTKIVPPVTLKGDEEIHIKCEGNVDKSECVGWCVIDGETVHDAKLCEDEARRLKEAKEAREEKARLRREMQRQKKAFFARLDATRLRLEERINANKEGLDGVIRDLKLNKAEIERLKLLLKSNYDELGEVTADNRVAIEELEAAVKLINDRLDEMDGRLTKVEAQVGSGFRLSLSPFLGVRGRRTVTDVDGTVLAGGSSTLKEAVSFELGYLRVSPKHFTLLANGYVDAAFTSDGEERRHKDGRYLSIGTDLLIGAGDDATFLVGPGIGWYSAATGNTPSEASSREFGYELFVKGEWSAFKTDAGSLLLTTRLGYSWGSIGYTTGDAANSKHEDRTGGLLGTVGIGWGFGKVW